MAIMPSFMKRTRTVSPFRQTTGSVAGKSLPLSVLQLG